MSSDSSSSDPNLAAIRESFGRCVYTHKTHEKAREIASSYVTATKWVNILLTTATGGSILSTIITNQRALLYASAAFAAATLAFGIFQLSFDPAGDVERHRTAAKKLWFVREKYINLLADMQGGLSHDEVVRRRDELMNEAGSLYEQAPDTSPRSYRRAQTALKVNEDMTFTDDEIDAFLPRSLRAKSR